MAGGGEGPAVTMNASVNKQQITIGRQNDYDVGSLNIAVAGFLFHVRGKSILKAESRIRHCNQSALVIRL